MSTGNQSPRAAAGKPGAIPILYPGVDPLQLEQFLAEHDYNRIKQFPNVYVLPLCKRQSDRAQACFGAGLARVLIRNLMLLRSVSIHGPEDTSLIPHDSAGKFAQDHPASWHVTGVAGYSNNSYSLQVELLRAGEPNQRAQVQQSDFKQFVFDCSAAVARLLNSEVTDDLRQAWTIAQPRDAQSLVQLGRIHLDLPREKTAERTAAARALLSADPDLSVAAWNIDDEVPGAQLDLLSNLERDPYNAQLCFEMFLTIWNSKGPQPEALQYCRKAIELSPGHGKAHMCAPHAAQRPALMLNHSELGYRLLPGNPFAVNNYVLALTRANAPVSKRIELAREGIASDPRDPGSYDRLIELCSSIGDFKTALATAERLQRLYEPVMNDRALYCLRQNPARAKAIDAGQFNPAAENRQRIAVLRQKLAAPGGGHNPSAPASQVPCPYCHQQIDRAAFDAHVTEHRKLRPDGQQTEYVTLPPEQQEQGSLAGVPRWYVHRTCGAVTGMPVDIIRSYLKNPYLYNSDRTYCTGCKTHVPQSECVWQETGENLQTYIDRVRAAKPQLRAANSQSAQPPPVAASGQTICSCGKPLPSGASYCRRCGHPVAQQIAGGIARVSLRGRADSTPARTWVIVGVVLLLVVPPFARLLFSHHAGNSQSSTREGETSSDPASGDSTSHHNTPKPRPPRATMETLGLKKSKLIGGTGGGTYEYFSKTLSPVVGFRFKMGRNGRKPVVSFLEPIFREDNTVATDDTVMARDGYVVSGIRVNGHVAAVQVIFTREQNGQLAAGDTYESQWLGENSEPDTNLLDGNNRPLMGLYGRRGMNIDAIGVIYPGS